MATAKEVKILLVAAKWRKRYDDCNPEVGMGPLSSTLVQEVADEAELDLQDQQKEWLADQLDQIDRDRYS